MVLYLFKHRFYGATNRALPIFGQFFKWGVVFGIVINITANQTAIFLRSGFSCVLFRFIKVSRCIFRRDSFFYFSVVVVGYRVGIAKEGRFNYLTNINQVSAYIDGLFDFAFDSGDGFR
jgi:hypothetical protein